MTHLQGSTSANSDPDMLRVRFHRCAHRPAVASRSGGQPMPLRPCLDCGLVTNASRCPEHRRARERARDARRAPAKAERYDAQHRALRRHWTRLVAAGGVNCTRCHTPIHPDDDWHLDHRPWGSEPAHAHCNASAGGRRAP